MKWYLGAAAAVFTWTFSSLAIAQAGQSSDSFSHLNRPAPPPAAGQMSPEATAAAAQERIAADKKTGKVPDGNTLQMLLAAQSKLKDAGMADTLEDEAADYNDRGDWTEIIAITFGTPRIARLWADYAKIKKDAR